MAKSNETLEKLKRGILQFQSEVYPARREEYEYAATHPQKPHTLLITCADSRIDPEALTHSGPGEIFVARNVGNMVPAYGDMLGGVSAVIEYAVDALKVNHAVVCGHTDCGAMKGILAGEGALDAMPTVKTWLRNADAAKRVAQTIDGEKPALHTMTEQNVLLQLQHLRTHPSVAGAIARGDLTLSGWVYDIGHGDVRIYDEAANRFLSVRESVAQEATA
ncbi:carbonic anhydrase [Terriglobus roseus]|uniref:carbonic anhydrase n=1 Tax=Terriglobus roseus TaxID=392734 RepID=A0A1G7FFH9_9BACT|nr:carbonic anhydrase [Terriglobus roseus]SDE74654.1 carbonic anhydrase [Terriglobus roseus]